MHLSVSFEQSISDDHFGYLMVSKVDYEDDAEVRRRTWFTMSESQASLIVDTVNVVAVDNDEILITRPPMSTLTDDLTKRDGQLHGICRYYYNGKLAGSTNYRDGQRHGQSVYYTTHNGQIHTNYIHGRVHGWTTTVVSDGNSNKTKLMDYYFRGSKFTIPLISAVYFSILMSSLFGLTWLGGMVGVPPPYDLISAAVLCGGFANSRLLVTLISSIFESP